MLNIVVHDLELICDAAEIPDEISISLAGLEVGDTIHISNIALPAGAKPAATEDLTIATIVAPSALKSTEDAAEDAAADAAAAAED